MEEKEVQRLLDNVSRLIDAKIDERVGSFIQVKAGTIVEISPDGLLVSVKLFADNCVLTDIQNYDVRKIEVGMPCFVGYWGAAGRHLSQNVFLFLGGDEFR